MLVLLAVAMLKVNLLYSACNCNIRGSLTRQCDKENGKCTCKPGFKGRDCDECMDPRLIFPNCQPRNKCRCNKYGTWFMSNSTSECIDKVSCVCKKHVEGVDCSQCKENYYNLSQENYATGCLPCNCDSRGTLAQVKVCDKFTGQCICKDHVNGRTCSKCKEGFHLLTPLNPFGCTACECNPGGSVNSKCNDYGQCECVKNVVGLKCDRLKSGPFYIPTFYHNVYEAEHGYASNKTNHVELLHHHDNFPNFTGRGYISLSSNMPSVKLDIYVRKESKYKLLLRYTLNEKKRTSIKMNIKNSENGKEYLFVSNILNGISKYSVAVSEDEDDVFKLTKGTWVLELDLNGPPVFLDHVVLLPEDYSTASSLIPSTVQPCRVDNPNRDLCLMYQYIKLKSFPTIQAESGKKSTAYGNAIDTATNTFNEADILKKLPVIGGMAELSRNQVSLTLQVTVDVTDSYVILITYFNPNDKTQRITVMFEDEYKRGYFDASPCFYRSMCRSAVINNQGNMYVKKFRQGSAFTTTLLGNVFGKLGIDYVTIIPLKDWTYDYLRLFERCHMKNGICQNNRAFPKSRKMVELPPNRVNRLNQFTKSIFAGSEKTVYFDTKSVLNVSYHLIYQYYQPHFPRFTVKLDIVDASGKLVKTENLMIDHCPAKIGCRGYLSNLYLKENSLISFKIPAERRMWFDSVFLIQSVDFEYQFTVSKRKEMSDEFQKKCLNAGQLPYQMPPNDFCKEALFSLTTRFVGKAFSCECNKQGSRSSKCSTIGGKCDCKKGVTGRKCDQCLTGYYGFPFCRSCKCSKEGSLSPDCNQYGECKCRLLHFGKNCDRCAKGSWGYPNCRECSCDRRGSFTLDCRLSDGQCSCLGNYAGKQCNKCQIGFFKFPICESCNCHSAGVTISSEAPTGCYIDDPGRCDCKRFVDGPKCDVCKDGYYNLQFDNPYGCSYCNCSSFGTIPGENICNKKAGQCACLPNVIGRRCDACADGFFEKPNEGLFKCEACNCNSGGSLDSTCHKKTGQCSCKTNITGKKCNNYNGNVFLPSYGEIVFPIENLVPFSQRKNLQHFTGNFVNASFASAKQKFQIYRKQSYYIAISYAVLTDKKPKIAFEFSYDDISNTIHHTFRSKKVEKSKVDIIKTADGFVKLSLEPGEHFLQLVFFDELLIDRITLIPVKEISQRKIEDTSAPTCTIKKKKDTICKMYTYYFYKNKTTIKTEFEDYSSKIRNDPGDSLKNPGADIPQAVYLNFIRFEKTFNMAENYYIVVHYMNFNHERSIYQVISHSFNDYQLGFVRMEHCMYLFACRAVVQSYRSEGKKIFSKGNGERIFTFQLTSGIAIYFDFMLIIPESEWNIHHVTPGFSCNFQSYACLNRTFPTTEGSLILHTKNARSMKLFTENVPGIFPPVKALCVSNTRRDLRWFQSFVRGGFYMLIHYFQPIFQQFASKIIITSRQTAVAGKVVFSHCPSIYGCRSVVTYLDGNWEQYLLMSGNILRLTFTLPPKRKVWIDRILFIPVSEYKNGETDLLNIKNPSLTKRLMRKCIGRRFELIDNSQKYFCQKALFKFHLKAKNSALQQCSCDIIGARSPACNFFDGTCSCKKGFTGPSCRRKDSRLFRY